MHVRGKNKKTIIYFPRLRRIDAERSGVLECGGMAILFRHGSSVRLSGVMIGKLPKEKIREQSSEKKGLRGGEWIYFGCGGLTGTGTEARRRRGRAAD
jgi:hypothetical protein